MELKLSLVIILFAAIFTANVINMIRKEKLGLKYALSWLVMALFISVTAIVPDVIVVISRIIGVATPINAVFFMGFVFSLIIIFTLTVSLSRASSKITKLTQEVALLEKKIEFLNIK
jgi:hypothetical protein